MFLMGIEDDSITLVDEQTMYLINLFMFYEKSPTSAYTGKYPPHIWFKAYPILKMHSENSKGIL